ncbi:hypothetical protein [Amycolatopsis magusensis]|uniref:Uncharacterized protein n=1 Tax=Amycolatopsis magusensis TaxID=882444 RepID=A0ABS4PZ96_9PSEU|nr:hypothetical protein [Amycolatopsis magusensis]MBP2183896.1 hypothetical protein [Amycolatopsis magusensis]
MLAVQYPAEPDVVREVEIRGLARTVGLTPHVPFDYTRFSGGRNLLDRAILLGEGREAIRVPRGHWFVVHPRPGKPLFEVLSDAVFRGAFAGADHTVAGRRAVAAAVAAEAHYHLGREIELRYLDAADHTSGMWAHPVMQAVIADIREQLRERDAELWEAVDPGEQQRWDRNRAVLPIIVRVRPEASRHGGTHGQARHAVPDTDTRGSRRHRGGRALCESASRPAPMPLGPVTVAPPDCPRCLTHLRRIAERHGLTLEVPPAPPPPHTDESDKAGPQTPSVAAELADLGEGWRLVQYTDSDRWWLQHDRIRGYIHRYTNLSGNKTGWEAFQFIGHGRYRHLDATSAAKHRPNSSYLWRSVALAVWGIATTPRHDTPNPTWTRSWRPPRNTS